MQTSLSTAIMISILGLTANLKYIDLGQNFEQHYFFGQGEEISTYENQEYLSKLFYIQRRFNCCGLYTPDEMSVLDNHSTHKCYSYGNNKPNNCECISGESCKQYRDFEMSNPGVCTWDPISDSYDSFYQQGFTDSYRF